jgi:TPR repeat protein
MKPLSRLLAFVMLLAAPAVKGGEIEDLTTKAKAGDVEAQLKLGSLYVSGRGVKKNSAEAAVWFQSAAEKGNAAAQRQMARMHLAGAGVPKDNEAAYRWAVRAANQGDPAAKQILTFLRQRMTPDQIRKAEAPAPELPPLPAPEPESQPAPEGVPLTAPSLEPLE